MAAGVAVRTLQEFLADFVWDHQRADRILRQLVMDRHGTEAAIGVIDASAHVKQGEKTPGVKRHLGIYAFAGPDAGVVEYVVDDQPPQNPQQPWAAMQYEPASNLAKGSTRGASQPSPNLRLKKSSNRPSNIWRNSSREAGRDDPLRSGGKCCRGAPSDGQAGCHRR